MDVNKAAEERVEKCMERESTDEEERKMSKKKKGGKRKESTGNVKWRSHTLIERGLSSKRVKEIKM